MVKWPTIAVSALTLLGVCILTTPVRGVEAASPEPYSGDPTVAPSVGAQQVAPEARGFSAPTLDGDWRFRLALNGWIPDSIPITVNAGNRSGSKTLDIGFILDHLGYALPFDGEVRKARSASTCTR